MSEPLPCPFCGSPHAAVDAIPLGPAFVVCAACQAFGPTKRTADEAVAAWNAAPRPLAPDDDAVHCWFELSYAQYLTVPRSVLQSMDAAWQARFVACLRELEAAIDWRPKSGRYWVQMKDAKGRYVADPLMDYERGRRRVPHRGEPDES